MNTVLITGGSRGIGAATAVNFAKKGWRVVINYNTSRSDAEMLAKSIGATTVRADISKSAEVENMANILANLGLHIDCIVNNAGISQDCLFTQISEDDWDRMFDINVKGSFLVTKAFLPQMIAKQAGSIVNISSIWGEIGASTEVHYSASKAAVIGMTKALAKELAPSNIRVNCVTPGYVDTKMNSRCSKEDLCGIVQEIPLSRIGNSAEIANVIEFLASDLSSYITGQVIGVNGGWNI